MMTDAHFGCSSLKKGDGRWLTGKVLTHSLTPSLTKSFGIQLMKSMHLINLSQSLLQGQHLVKQCTTTYPCYVWIALWKICLCTLHICKEFIPQGNILTCVPEFWSMSALKEFFAHHPPFWPDSLLPKNYKCASASGQKRTPTRKSLGCGAELHKKMTLKGAIFK